MRRPENAHGKRDGSLGIPERPDYANLTSSRTWSVSTPLLLESALMMAARSPACTLGLFQDGGDEVDATRPSGSDSWANRDGLAIWNVLS
jgi:hypothetical protein